MKKTLIILATAAISLVACNKELVDNTQPLNDNHSIDVVFELTANHPDGTATKAVKTGWESGDVIYVFFDNIAAPKYLKMSYDGSAWTTTQMNGASEESLGLVEDATGTMRAVYLPFGNTLTVSADGTAFNFSETTCSYYLTATLDYTVTGGKVSGAFNMQIPAGYVQFFLEDAGASSSTEIEIREPHLTPQGIASIAADGTIIHTGIASGAPLKGYVYDKEGETKGYLFSGILAAGARNTETTYYFTLVSGGWEGSYYSKTFADKTWYRGATEGRALKMPVLMNWTLLTDYLPIDLGCDVGGKRIYWSSRNLGATRSGLPAANTDDARHATWGDYYAWGDIVTYYTAGAYGDATWDTANGKTGYNWASYKYNPSGNGTTFTKYSPSVDSYTVLKSEDDVAAQTLGGNWRIPTVEEWSAIANTTNFTWGPRDGTNLGRAVTVKSGTVWTDPTIFIPAAGNRDNASLVLSNYQGRIGCYWSSTIYEAWSWENAQYFSMYLGKDNLTYYAGNRRLGMSIRPVSD